MERALEDEEGNEEVDLSQREQKCANYARRITIQPLVTLMIQSNFNMKVI